MSAQVNYVCWSPEVVSSTIPTEAATPSNEVLLATHAPLRVTRRSGSRGRDQASELVSEQQVLQEFLEAEPNNGVLVAAVLGESGAGKSHLVRWVNAQIPRQPNRHVVYLQKTETSLRDVIEALLVGQRDPEFDEIRRKASSLGSGMTLDEMEHKILAELAEALRSAPADNPYAKALVGNEGLRLFFTDPLFEKHLLREGSFIRRRAQHALRGRDADEGDIPLEFTAQELPLDIGDYSNIQDAAATTQRLFRRLVGAQAMQAEAVRLINDNLDVAVMKAASLAVGDIGKAFKKIREKLLGDEIVLLIEDVALIQGVRRDLLDAVIEVGVIQGVERYATVRTLMAVTPSYYREQLPETFRRRSEASSPVYEVDVELEGTTATEDDLIDFVGRYLNAGRVGKARLEREAPIVANACNSCQFQISCHSTFGASRQEYGLYPYNRSAILRAIRACVETDSGRDSPYFNPRKVLSRAVRHVLMENASTIRAGSFPPADFLADESANVGLPRLPVHIREHIESELSEDESGRLEALVTFWGRVGAEPVSNGILSAFSHPPLPAGVYDAEAPPRDVAPPRDPAAEKVGELRPSVQSQLDAIDAWSQGKPLPQSIAADMRTIFRESLLSRIDWFDPVIKEPDSAAITRAVPNNSRSISIEGAAAENLVKGAEPLLLLERSARMAVTFKGLALLKAGFPERASDALPRVDGILAPKIAVAKQRIVDALQISDTELVGAMASLIRGAMACGVVPPKPTELDVVAASLWRESGTRADNGSRLPEWTTAYQDYVVARASAIDRLLGAVGAAQGAGAVHAIDFTRLAAIATAARQSTLNDVDLEVPEWCKDSDTKLRALTRLSSRQLAHWRGLLERVRVHLPNGSLSETVDAIDSAVREGQAQGLVLVSDLASLSARNTAARSLDSRSITEVERLLAAVSTLDDANLYKITGVTVGGDLQAITDYLEFSSQWVTAGVSQADSSGGQAADIDDLMNEAIASWLAVVEGVEVDE